MRPVTWGEAERAARDGFYNHLMGDGARRNCCYGPTDRYCPEGKRLKEAYERAVST